MSFEKATTDEPSRYLNGEGCQGRTRTKGGTGSPQSLASVQRVGGVSGGSGLGRGDGISWEISAGGLRSNAQRNSAFAGKAGTARREVGSVRSSDESRNEAGAKGPNLVGVNSETMNKVMAPSLGI
jgi:hypothetical protein